MTQIFSNEREGQIAFFEELKIGNAVELANNTDGVYRGTLFEFKLNIGDTNRVLFQAIKYLSHLRIRGKSIPRNILLVSLNDMTAYLYDSQDFVDDIEKIYNGAASRNNQNFYTNKNPQKIDYSGFAGLKELIQVLDTDNFTPIHIDVFCVVGWADRYYSENPKAKKIDFFEELRNPKYFQKFIYPWDDSELKFQYIMDCLNDPTNRKELGAFYTPPAYCKKATELVRKAISQIPTGNDYIILDRCAGTGNLQEFLTDKSVNDITIGELDKYLTDDFINKYLEDKKNVIRLIKRDFNSITCGELEQYQTKIDIHKHLFDNEIGHCIVNTYELKEWIVLNERIGDKVKMIIPPYEDVNTNNSLVNGGDALSSTFVLGDRNGTLGFYNMSESYYFSIAELNAYIKDPQINIIMFENPPYSEVAGGNNKNRRKENEWKKSFIATEMKKEIKGFATNDLTNLFIWSAFKYYLTKENDSYVLFSPVKYFKSQDIVNKKFIEGYIFNRQYFHCAKSAISCIFWKNEEEFTDKWGLIAMDLQDNILIDKGVIEIKEVYQTQNSVMVSADSGFAVLCSQGFDPDYKHGHLTNDFVKIAKWHNTKNLINGDNYLKYIPYWVSNNYNSANFYEKNVYFKTSDGGTKYEDDIDFLKSCFIFTCLSNHNNCLTFIGPDNIEYRNELCFDKGTLASDKLNEYKLTEQEKELISIWERVLVKSQETPNYNSNYSYGTYQIDKELNTRHKDERDNTIYDYPELNGELNALKTHLSMYYNDVILPKLFEYELLK